MIIAVDAAGGEYAPHEIVKGALKAAHDYGVGIALIGRKDLLHVQAGRHRKDLDISLVDASQTIDDHESPVEAISTKPDSSIMIGVNMVKSGEAAAFVSAGNTGAVFFASLAVLGRIPGIDRPAVGSIINVNVTSPVLLIDSGANANCRANHLVQFAQLGTIYAREVLGVASPRVGLLNNGIEESKGNRLMQETHGLLKEADLNFIGNVEGQSLFRGDTDVIVADGFTGNIVLKTLEGLGDTFLKLRNVAQVFSKASHGQSRHDLIDVGLGSLVRRIDYRESGGACLLGVDGDVIISHGRSQSKAIRNAIGLAKRSVDSDIRKAIKQQHEQWAATSEEEG